MSGTRVILDAKQIRVSYSGHQVLQIDNLAVAAGEIVGVVGANGAGKTTLVNSLLGWSRSRPAVSAEVTLDGSDVSRLSTHERVRLGLLLVPEPRLAFALMTVEENLTAAVVFRERGLRHFYTCEEVYEVFPQLRERRNHLGGQLSGGERQMLGIGRALVMGPRALLLDEPSIGLAPMLVTQVMRSLRVLADRGLAVLLVEQNVRAALQVVNRLVVLERGRIVMQGSAAEIGNDPRIAEAYLGGTQA